MRIFNFSFFYCLFLLGFVLISPLYGDTNKTDYGSFESFFPVRQDTICGITDTVFQVAQLSCNGAMDASATVQWDSLSGPISIIWDNGDTLATAIGLSAGLHYVTLTDTSGCVQIDSLFIADKAALEYSLETIDALCIGSEDGIARIEDTLGYRYVWSTGDSTNSVDGLIPGSYSVTISDTLGCSAIETFSIGMITSARLEIAKSDATCAGINDGMIAVNDTLNLSGYTYAWNIGDSTNTLTGLAPGNYVVTVTSSGNCIASDTVSIGVTRAITVDLTVTNASCFGVEDGSIIVNDSMDITGFSFGWNTGDTTQMISGIAAGTYVVAVADPFGCLGAASAIVRNATNLEIVVSKTDETCSGASDGSIAINDTMSVEGFSFSWNTGDSTQIISGLSAGNYLVTVTDSLGCQVNQAISLNSGTVPNLIISKTDATNNQNQDGSITINDTLDITGLSFAWSTGDSTQTINGLAIGEYTVTVTGTNGCTASASITINALMADTIPELNIEINKTDATCNGVDDGSITINDTLDITGLSFAWSTGDSTQTINGLSPGAYTVTVTNSQGDSISENIVITTATHFEIGLTGANISCFGFADGLINAAVIGNDTGPYTYQWSTGDTTSSINSLDVGEYDVTVTDTLGCFAIAGVNLGQPDSIVITGMAQDVCMNPANSGSIAAIATGGTGNFSYLWNTQDTTNTLTGLEVGTYTITVTDSLGCSRIDSFQLSTLPALSANAIVVQAATCDGNADGIASVMVSGGTPEYSLNWNTGQISTEIGDLNPGLYTVTATDAMGCLAFDSITISESIQLTINLTELVPASTPASTDASVSGNATGGTAPYSFEWDNGETADTAISLTAGNHTVTVTDANGCFATQTININFNQIAVSIIEVRDARCNGGASGRATAAPLEGTTPFRYQWSRGDTTPTVTNLLAGTYTITVTDALGLKGTASISISEPEPIRFNMEVVPPTCPTSANGIVRIFPSNTVGNYLIDFGFGLTSNGIIGGLSSGQRTFRILAGNGCEADTTFFLEPLSPGLPEPGFTVDSEGFFLAFTDTSRNEPINYLWEFGDGTTSIEMNPIHEYADSGNYEICLTVTNNCGFQTTCNTVFVEGILVPGVDLIFGRDTSSLAGTSVQIPVTVGNFEDVIGIQGTFEIAQEVAAIQRVRDFNLPFLGEEDFVIQPDYITMSWFIEDTNFVSLPVGTQIFVIDVLLTGNTGDCTQITGSNAQLNLEFSKNFMNESVRAPFTISAGEICVAPTVSIAGNISKEEGTGVAGVLVSTNNSTSFTTLTDGNYNLGSLFGGTTFTVIPTKGDDILEGVTTFDLVAIMRHILTRELLTSPYKIIAADIDNSLMVNSLDLVQLQRLLLGEINEFPNNAPWRFVPETYNFTNPTNPLAETFPESLVLTQLDTDTSNIDFVAIKTGDVIEDISRRNAQNIQDAISFNIKDQTFEVGDLVTISFEMKQVERAMGFQFELEFDPDVLMFKQTQKDNYLQVDSNNFGTKDIENGRLKMLWLNLQQLPIKQLKNGLFQLEFIAKRTGRLSKALGFVQEDFVPQFYTERAQAIGLQELNLHFFQSEDRKADVPAKTPLSPEFFNQGEDDEVVESCFDGLDNDNDNLTDCADADCFCECNGPTTSDNLILNPGAELPIGANGWEESLGNWENRAFNPRPQDGAFYFYPGQVETGQLTQIIDLSADSANIAAGRVQFIFSGYVRSFDQFPSDEAQVTVEYRSDDGTVLSAYNSGITTNRDGWLLLTDTTLAPPGTSTVVIFLTGNRKNGNDNDAYFDNLSLVKVIGDVCNDPCAEISISSSATSSAPNSQSGTATTTVLGGQGNISYNWSTGDTTPIVSGLMPGTYLIEAYDSIGCSVRDVVEVLADSSFFLTLSATNPACSGDSTGAITTTVTGGVQPFTFDWSTPGIIGYNANNLAAGTYSVTVTDSLGTSVSSSITLTDGVSIFYNRDSSKIVNETCPGTHDGNVNLVVEGGTPPYTYSLDGRLSNTGIYRMLSAQTYPLTITDTLGCSSLETVVIENTFPGDPIAAFDFEFTDSSIVFTNNSTNTPESFRWTFGDGSLSTEENPTFTYDAPGVYEVCLTADNTCGSATTCQTIQFGTTGPVTFIVNDLNGVGNDTVLVPVMVENFANVLSFQKTIQIQDPRLAKFVGISDINLTAMNTDNFYLANDSTITTVWLDPSNSGQHVPNGTVIYNLILTLNIDIDTCIGITIQDSPVPVQVVGNQSDGVGEVPFTIINGEVCTRASVSISGNISRETGAAVPDVEVRVSNNLSSSLTNNLGNYDVQKLAIGNDYEITPSLNTLFLENVSTFDIVLINRHILGNRLLDSPYKLIAADVNRSNSITVFDLVLIQRAILGLNTAFPNNESWRFIPKSYVFPDPTDPFANPFPESINLVNLTNILEGLDFIGVKVADVSYTLPTEDGNTNPRTNKTLVFSTDNQSFKKGDLVEIPISANHLDQMVGFQLELDFDKNSLEFNNIQTASLPNFDENNVGLNYLKEGKIQLVWVAPELEVRPNSPTLFTLNFKAKRAGVLNKVIQAGNRYLVAESYTNELQIGKVKLNFNEKKVVPTIVNPVLIHPNPNDGKFEVIFSQPIMEKAQIAVYNLTGQLVQETIKPVVENNITLNLINEPNGTYLVVIKQQEGVEIKRVVLSR